MGTIRRERCLELECCRQGVAQVGSIQLNTDVWQTIISITADLAAVNTFCSVSSITRCGNSGTESNMELHYRVTRNGTAVKTIGQVAEAEGTSEQKAVVSYGFMFTPTAGSATYAFQAMIEEGGDSPGGYAHLTESSLTLVVYKK